MTLILQPLWFVTQSSVFQTIDSEIVSRYKNKSTESCSVHTHSHTHTLQDHELTNLPFSGKHYWNWVAAVHNLQLLSWVSQLYLVSYLGGSMASSFWAKPFFADKAWRLFEDGLPSSPSSCLQAEIDMRNDVSNYRTAVKMRSAASVRNFSAVSGLGIPLQCRKWCSIVDTLLFGATTEQHQSYHQQTAKKVTFFRAPCFQNPR